MQMVRKLKKTCVKHLNGTKKLQNKALPEHSLKRQSAIFMATAQIRMKKKLLNGIKRLQNKEVLMR